MSAPTAVERRFMAAAVALGCMACRQEGNETPAEFHHWRRYGYRKNLFGYGLCGPHHRQTAAIKGILNRHGDPKEFAAKYGSDETLFNELKIIMEK